MIQNKEIQKYNAPEGSWRAGLALMVAIALLAYMMIQASYIREAHAGILPGVDPASNFPLSETIKNTIIDDVPTKQITSFEAIQTKYSRKDSCHYPKTVNGKVICLTAIGRDTKEGTTVACPRNLKLGTRIFIEGLDERVCEDRYNEDLDEKRGLPTIDVFAEAEHMHSLPGRKYVTVYVLN